MKPENEQEPIAEQLRRDALAERPAFSADLHRRLLHDIRAAGDQRIPPRWIPLAAAAAIVIGAAILAMRWHASFENTAPSNPSLIAGGGSPGSPPTDQRTGASAPGYQGNQTTAPPPPNFSLQFGGLATVQMSPTRLLIAPPPTPVPPTAPAVADVTATPVLQNLLPPSLREFAGLAMEMTP